jgi:hypothetical protein
MAAAQRTANQVTDGEIHDRAWWEVEARRCGTDRPSLLLQRSQVAYTALLYGLRAFGQPLLQNPRCRWALSIISDAQLEELIAALIRLQPNYPSINSELILALDGILRP